MSQPTFIVIGATGGIGRAVCSDLSGTANLVVAARTEADLNELAREHAAVAVPTDATDYQQVENLVAEAENAYARIDGMVNCAGSILLKPAHLTSADEFADVVAINLTTAFNTVKAGARAMMKSGGSIALCSSAVALTGLPNHEAIAAAKSAVVGLARSAAATYANRNIRVNCVAPGLTRTPQSKFITDNPASVEKSVSLHPLKRLGEPADIASAITWLLDPRNNWVTGQVIGVDGGLSSVRAR